MLRTLLPTRSSRPGVIVLLMMMVTTAIIIIFALSLAFSSINTSRIAMHQQSAAGVFFNLDGCIEEALARLNRNNVYAGGLFVIGTTSCTISLSGTDPNRVITIDATNGDYFRKVQIGVTIFPNFVVTSWQELAN